MSKEEIVEVRVRVPKWLVDLLEAEGYFGYSKEEFFESAMKSLIGGVTGAMHYEKEEEFIKKHGKDATRYYLPKGFEDDC